MNTSDVSKLRELVRGRVLEPSDAGYEQVRSVFYRGYDRHPAAIVRPRDGADVAAAVTLATATGAELAVRSGGHSIAGHGATEGGIVIDMRDMRAFDIDTDGRTAWAGTGLTAGEYTRAAGAHGLATGFGDTGSVGIGGITLAGGIGLLVRKYGLTIDSLLAAEIVTADGRLLRVDGDNHPDLFWAIRGGGGNFGVATRFRYRLHEVDRVVGGILVLPAAPDVVLGLVALAEEASDDLTTIFNLMKAPPLPFIPPEYHGEPVVACMMIHAGDLDAGERAADRVRKVAPPIVDMVKPIRYPEFFEFGGAPPSVEHEVSHTRFLDEIDKRLVAGLLEQVARSPARLASAQLRVLGGAMARVPEAATAFAHRGRKYLATVGAAYEDGAKTSVHEEWIRRVTSLFTPENPGAYSGFLGTDGAARIHEAYPGRTRDRLVEIKRRYDPDNLFRLNHNIDAG